MSLIGPALPPHLRKAGPVTAPTSSAFQSTDNDDEDDDDDFGPALPPHLAAARKVAGPSLPSAQAGPSRPPPSFTTTTARPSSSRAQPPKPTNPYGDDDDDDDEDDYLVGPNLAGGAHGAPMRTAAEEFMEREARWAKEREEASKPKELKREEWMLVPPKNSTLAETLGDPLKIKARGFARSADDAPRERDQTLWTETPVQRQQRLQDEMMGKKRKLENADDNAGDDDLDDMKRRRRDEEIQASVRSHNSRHRAAPMVDIHSRSKTKSNHSSGSTKDTNGKKQDPDEPPPIWDRDLHMGVTGKLMQDKDRMKMLKDAKNLGDRFGKGSYA